MANIKIFLMIISLLLSACGGKDEDKKQDGVEGEELYGSWSGIQKVALTGEAQLARTVRVVFEPGGVFAISFQESGDKITGEFSHFVKLGAVALKVASSTNTQIAVTGSIYDFEYEIVENELLLKGFEQQFRLKREASSDNTQAIEGAWVCQNEDSRDSAVWQLTMTKNTFVLQRQISGSAPLTVQGSLGIELTANNGAKTTLKVESSRPQIAITAFELSVVSAEDQQSKLLITPSQDYAEKFALFCARA